MIKSGDSILKIEDVPEIEHWQMITIDSIRENDGYGGDSYRTCFKIQVFFTLPELEKTITDSINNTKSFLFPKPYWIQHVKGRAKISTMINVSVK